MKRRVKVKGLYKNLLYFLLIIKAFFSVDLEARQKRDFYLKSGQESSLAVVIQNSLPKPKSNFLVGVDGNKNLTNDSNAIVNSMGAGKRRFGGYTRAFWESIKDQVNIALHEDKILMQRLVSESRLRPSESGKYQRMCMYFIYNGRKFYLFDPWPPRRVKRRKKRVKFGRGVSIEDGWRYPISRVIRKYKI
jgi:hypothetical protein